MSSEAVICILTAVAMVSLIVAFFGWCEAFDNKAKYENLKQVLAVLKRINASKRKEKE